jgi:hypothetical protein
MGVYGVAVASCGGAERGGAAAGGGRGGAPPHGQVLARGRSRGPRRGWRWRSARRCGRRLRRRRTRRCYSRRRSRRSTSLWRCSGWRSRRSASPRPAMAMMLRLQRDKAEVHRFRAGLRDYRMPPFLPSPRGRKPGLHQSDGCFGPQKVLALLSSIPAAARALVLSPPFSLCPLALLHPVVGPRPCALSSIQPVPSCSPPSRRRPTPLCPLALLHPAAGRHHPALCSLVPPDPARDT